MRRTTLLDDNEGSSAPGTDTVAEEIGRFSVVGRLGAGGMGQVFEAYDRELDRRVAVKVLHEHAVGSASGTTRLLREAQAIAKLSHPNVVGVYDVGRHGGEVYIAMEFIQGRTLSDWLRETPRSWTDVVRIFDAVAQGLQAMHELGIVHRDASAFIHPVLRIPGFLGVVGVAFGVAMPARCVMIQDLTMGASLLALLVIVPRRKSLPWISRAASSTGSSGVIGDSVPDP